MGVHVTVSSLGIRLLYALFIFSIPIAASVDSMVSRIGPKWFTKNGYGVVGPICDTLQSIVEARKFVKMQKA